MKKLFLVGAGGHCVSCIDVIESSGQYDICGIFDFKDKIGQKVLGYPIIGSDLDINKYVSSESYFLICVGQIKSPDSRVNIFQNIQSLGGRLATVISPRAYVSRHAQIGEGSIVMHDALVNANAVVGKNCIINTKALLEHDVAVHNHCHVSTAAVLNGNVVVNERTFIGSNAVVRESISIPPGSIISAGYFYK